MTPVVLPRFYCRVHGEFLRHDAQLAAWVCPERPACGTWVGDEYVAGRRAS